MALSVLCQSVSSFNFLIFPVFASYGPICNPPPMSHTFDIFDSQADACDSGISGANGGDDDDELAEDCVC